MMISLMEYQLSTLTELVVEDVVRVLGNKMVYLLIVQNLVKKLYLLVNVVYDRESKFGNIEVSNLVSHCGVDEVYDSDG